jgi:predicted histone-like DNA-binding protein
MKYRKVKRKNPRDMKADGKYYASPVNSGKITLNELSARIERNSSLSKGDILNVISNFLDEVPEYLKDGKSVQLGDFGTFRYSFSSKGAETPEQVNANSITSKRVIFTPGVKLKNQMADISFEEQK